MSSQTILLIDDDEALLFGLSAIIKQAGYQTLMARNGKDGLRLAAEHRPDLIICDVMMPSLNGFELRKHLSLQSNNVSIPFIFLTSKSSYRNKLYGLELGADDYIVKPFERAELIARIKAVLRRVELEQQKARRETENEMERLIQEIQRNISHELRTPIHIALAELQLALRKHFDYDPSRKERFMKRILRCAHQLETIITDLLFLNQLEPSNDEDFRLKLDLKSDLDSIVKKTIDNWKNRSLTVKMTIESELIIHAPPHGFRLAVRHLIDNAAKFSPVNGTIKISLAQNGLGGCIITVMDEGAGIQPELREKVFEPFFQVSQGYNRMYEGLGLGLYIVRAFARHLGGEVIILDSKSGCQVQMTIPPTENSTTKVVPTN